MKILTITLLATALGFFMTGCSPAQETAQSSQPAPSTSTPGLQTAMITIDGGKYTPSVISVEKGKPVEITFTGGKDLGCGGTVVFKSLKMSKDVESGKTVTFNFTPKEAGEIPFTCSMGMYDGKVVVK
ncbi:MAG: cupredoxin domain-containing protein [Fimbriimonadaceae bacterium]